MEKWLFRLQEEPKTLIWYELNMCSENPQFKVELVTGPLAGIRQDLAAWKEAAPLIKEHLMIHHGPGGSPPCTPQLNKVR